MRDCAYGKTVRLSALRVRCNRRQGVSHAIVHAVDDSPAACDGERWSCSAVKPYPKREEDKPWNQLLSRWEGKT